MTYLTVQNKDLKNIVKDGQAAGTFRQSQVIKNINTGVFGFKCYSGNSDRNDDMCLAGIIWMPSKNLDQVYALSKKYVLGYYTPWL